MAWYEPKIRPLPVQIARNALLWLVFVPSIIVFFNWVLADPMPDTAAWKRIALWGAPVVLVGAVIDALAERAVGLRSRAYGRGLATALVIYVLVGADGLLSGWDLPRLLKGLLITPILAMFFAVPQWAREQYISPTSPPAK